MIEIEWIEVAGSPLWRLWKVQKSHESVTLSGDAIWKTNSQVVRLCSQVIHRLRVVADAVHGG